MAKPHPEFLDIELTRIIVGEQQIRETPADDSIGELAESIQSKGLLQPIGVTKNEDDTYQLRWGHRRLLAHQRLGKAKIKAAVYDGAERSIKGLAFVENLHRSQMTMAEEVEAVTYLSKEEDKSVEQIATILNKSRSWVLNRVMIPDLPLYLRQPLMDGDLPISHLEIIARVPDEGAQRYLVAQDTVNKWNTTALKIIADCYMQPVPADLPPGSHVPGVSPNPVSQPFHYVCEMCSEKGILEDFTLVRIHKDGYGCRATPDRPDHPRGTIDEMASQDHGHQRNDDQDHH